MNNIPQSTTLSNTTAGTSCFDANHIDVTTIEDLEQVGSDKWTRYPGCIGAFIAEMDYGLAPCVAEAIEEATERGALGYIPDPWKKEVARSCAAWQRRYGWEVDPTCIRPVPDVLEAFEVFLREIVRAGNSIVVPTPAYMPFLSVPRLYGVEVLEIPMLCAGAGESSGRNDEWRHPFDIIALSKQFFGSILSLITPLIILAGFTSGSFTPTEASSIAVAYSLVIAVVVYHTIDWKAFKNCLLESAITSANTLFIIGTSTLFTYVLVKEGASKAIADFILGISSNPEVILLIINVVLLILGMFMEPGAILTLMLPVLLPIVKDLNIDLVHFGVVMVLNLMIGQVTPPFGVCLFVISDVAKIKLDKLYRSIIPFLAPLIIVLLMCTYIPDIVIWLPNLLVK